jgi:hypothetical protein
MNFPNQHYVAVVDYADTARPRFVTYRDTRATEGPHQALAELIRIPADAYSVTAAQARGAQHFVQSARVLDLENGQLLFATHLQHTAVDGSPGRSVWLAIDQSVSSPYKHVEQGNEARAGQSLMVPILSTHEGSFELFPTQDYMRMFWANIQAVIEPKHNLTGMQYLATLNGRRLNESYVDGDQLLRVPLTEVHFFPTADAALLKLICLQPASLDKDTALEQDLSRYYMNANVSTLGADATYLAHASAIEPDKKHQPGTDFHPAYVLVMMDKGIDLANKLQLPGRMLAAYDPGKTGEGMFYFEAHHWNDQQPPAPVILPTDQELFERFQQQNKELATGYQSVLSVRPPEKANFLGELIRGNDEETYLHSSKLDLHLFYAVSCGIGPYDNGGHPMGKEPCERYRDFQITDTAGQTLLQLQLVNDGPDITRHGVYLSIAPSIMDEPSVKALNLKTLSFFTPHFMEPAGDLLTTQVGSYQDGILKATPAFDGMTMEIIGRFLAEQIVFKPELLARVDQFVKRSDPYIVQYNWESRDPGSDRVAEFAFWKGFGSAEAGLKEINRTSEQLFDGYDPHGNPMPIRLADLTLYNFQKDLPLFMKEKEDPMQPRINHETWYENTSMRELEAIRKYIDPVKPLNQKAIRAKQAKQQRHIKGDSPSKTPRKRPGKG